MIAWSPERRALLHLENRTRFPNIQDAAGSFNAKRAYLAPAVAERLGIRRGFASVTHAIIALWSAEVQHVVRLRTATFRALAPDGAEPFAAWWRGDPPDRGNATTFVLFDPLPRRRSRQWVTLGDALRVEPRYRGYADAAAQIPTRQMQPAVVGGGR